jgi:hypothetical protein
MQRLVNAPTQALLQRWFREIHDIIITIEFWKGEKYVSKVHSKNHGLHICSGIYYSEPLDTYELALEDGLINAFKLITL